MPRDNISLTCFVCLFGAALSVPLVQAQSKPQLAILGTRDGLHLGLQGDPSASYRIEFSSDLKHWDPLLETYPSLSAFPASSEFEFADRNFLFEGQRQYRAVPSTAVLNSTSAPPDIQVSDNALMLNSGRTTQLSFNLAKQPVGTVQINLALQPAVSNLVLSATNFAFNAANWNTPQTVILTAPGTQAFDDSIANLILSSSNLTTRVVRVLIQDGHVDDEFAGPFRNWKDAKHDFGAVGDGIADDTTALQTALNTLRPYSNHVAVLYLPPGQYRFTKTLNFNRTPDDEPNGVTIVGADPASTVLRWDGASNSVMIAYGAWYSKMSRVTLDGAGKAKTAIAHDLPFSTHNEFSDMVFSNVSFGIEAGTTAGGGNAETAVERCQFIGCSVAGISMGNANSLDWFVWNSEFNDCGVGVGNLYGAGNFHVYESLFRRSRQADMSIGNTGFFSARNNTSIGSAAFFVSSPVPSSGLITIQGNTVLAPQGIPLQLGDFGPVLLLDNWIEDFQGLAGNIEPSSSFLSVGNVFTVPNAIPTGFNGPAGIRFDDVVSASRLATVLPKLPGPLPNLHRQVIEVSGPTNSLGIQQAIDSAVTFNGNRPIVHLPSGEYSVDATITIPAGSDLQLIGDGGTTVLKWVGAGTGPILHLAGPSRATLREFNVRGTTTGTAADGIVIDKSDQPSGRVYGDQLDLLSSTQTGLFVDGLTNTMVSLQDFYHDFNPVSVRVVGGSSAPNYNPNSGQVNIFGGASAANGLCYDVERGGKLLARDIWYEATATNSSPRFMVCTNSGWFTLHGAQVALLNSKPGIPVVEVSNFVGRVSFLTSEFTFTNGAVSVDGAGTNDSVMFAATLHQTQPQFNSTGATSALLQSLQTIDAQTINPFPDSGSTDPVWLRQMLAQTRQSRPSLLTPKPAGVTDVRMHRLVVDSCRIALHLTP